MRYPGPSTVAKKFIPQISEDDAFYHARLLKAISDPTRLRILSLLSQHEGDMCVSEIVECFTLEQPTISHHVSKLVSVNLISGRKKGLFQYYYINREQLNKVKGVVDLLM